VSTERDPVETSRAYADRAGADRADSVPRPADVDACGALGCTRTDHLRLVEADDGRERVLCPFHEKHFLEVST